MRALRFALLALGRDWRSGELAVLFAALLVAVTALTGVGFFTDRISQAVEQRAAEVLAADLRLRSARPLGEEYEALAAENPRLIMARVSGFGQTGPYAQRAGYGLIGEAMGTAISTSTSPATRCSSTSSARSAGGTRTSICACSTSAGRASPGSC